MTILVTGATGFLGGAVARKLLADGHSVRVSGRKLAAGAELVEQGASFIPGDLRNEAIAESLVQGCDVVIHSAAKSSLWGPKEAFWSSNVEGTRQLLRAAERHGVRRFVHVSTPSVYFEFKDSLNITEDAVLPSTFVNHYTASKHGAEQLVHEAAAAGLSAVILRPRALFGPGDTAIFPRIVRAMEAGRLRVIGDGKNLTDLTYIDNAAQACILAMTSDIPESGRIYNITDGTPVPLWPLFETIARALDYTPPRGRLPLGVARTAARAIEAFHARFRPNHEPVFTEYSVGLLGCTLTLDISRARQELGYAPTISSEDGLNHFLAWWREQHR